MNFPENILDRISHLFEDGSDDILIYVLVFLFIIFAGKPDGGRLDETAYMEGEMPAILMVIFLVLFLFSSLTKESAA